jgi:hypothetical protein
MPAFPYQFIYRLHLSSTWKKLISTAFTILEFRTKAESLSGIVLICCVSPHIQPHTLTVLLLIIRPKWSSTQVGSSTVQVEGWISYEVITFLNCPNPSNCIMAPGLGQSLTEMSTRNLLASKEWHHSHLWADCLENVGALTSHVTLGFHSMFTLSPPYWYDLSVTHSRKLISV